jgi:glycosyltransferase involved in cell wall biosynthesis
VILPGVIPDRDLPALYRTADAFCFPSTQEGWGLVVLEAIASGLPVITADQPPFTEFLTADQALLVDPDSTGAIAKAMVAVLNPGLAQPLIQKSQAILPRYTWQHSAQLHLQIYQQLG